MELQIKRGRPKKLTESELDMIKSKYQQLSEQKKDNLKGFKEYYNESVFTQNILAMISSIQKILSMNNLFTSLPLELLLIDTCKNQMVSEIELAAISLLLEKVNEEVHVMAGESLIECVAWVAKELLESDKIILNEISSKLKKDIKNFKEIERKIKISAKIDIKRLNIRYQALKSEKTFTINYSNYVIDILRHSPPYKKKKESNSDQKTFSNLNTGPGLQALLPIQEAENINEESRPKSKNIEDTEEFYQKLQDLHILYSEIEPFQQLDRKIYTSLELPEKILNVFDNHDCENEILSSFLNPSDLNLNSSSSIGRSYINSNKI